FGNASDRVGENGVFYQLATANCTEAIALVPIDQMRRGVDVTAVTGCLQQRTRKRRRRAFAIGPGNMNDGRHAFMRIAEPLEQTRNPRQRQVEPLRVEAHQPLDLAVSGLCSDAHGEAFKFLCKRGGVQAAASTGVPSCFRRIFRRRAMVCFSSSRETTMSTMPCSIRYSERWNPSGSFSRIVCSITRAPAKPITAPGSAMWTSPSIA